MDGVGLTITRRSFNSPSFYFKYRSKMLMRPALGLWVDHRLPHPHPHPHPHASDFEINFPATPQTHSSLPRLAKSVTPKGSAATVACGEALRSRLALSFSSASIDPSEELVTARRSYVMTPLGTAIPHISRRLTKLVNRPSFAFLVHLGLGPLSSSFTS